MDKVPPGFIEVNEIKDYWSFLRSIDWFDPWLICLVIAHLLVTTSALVTRSCGNFQVFVFLILLLLVYFSENINEFAATNWSSFSRKQYFDTNGLFISTVFSIPILLNCMLMIGLWLYNSTEIMTKLKMAQLRANLRRNQSLTTKKEE